ncbi:hypothetical protein V1499_01950 [Neobacillus sp. SCS-31]|uniref:hypothetical protein n=1 Tax=Neobacillus oceani TaxID=3115292 RepID=UPI003906AD00
MKENIQRNFASTVGGIFFILSAVVQIVALFGPPLAGDIEFLDWVLERPGYTLFFTFVVLAFTLFNVPALIGATHRVIGRGKWLAYIGSTLALIGNFFFIILVTEALSYRGMATLDREPMVELMQWTFDAPIYFVPHLLYLLMFYIGMIILTIGLYKARIASFWLVAAAIFQIVAGILDLGAAQQYVQAIVILAVFGGIGHTLMKNPQKESVSAESTINNAQ